MSDTPITDAAWLKRADSPRRQCSEQLERELAAYQAKMPEAPQVFEEEERANEERKPQQCVAKTDYDALAKRCAGLTMKLEAAQVIVAAAKELAPHLRLGWDECDEPEDQAMANPACNKLLAVVDAASNEKTERDWQTSPTVAGALGIDTVLAAGKEKAE